MFPHKIKCSTCSDFKIVTNVRTTTRPALRFSTLLPLFQKTCRCSPVFLPKKLASTKLLILHQLKLSLLLGVLPSSTLFSSSLSLSLSLLPCVSSSSPFFLHRKSRDLRLNLREGIKLRLLRITKGRAISDLRLQLLDLAHLLL